MRIIVSETIYFEPEEKANLRATFDLLDAIIENSKDSSILACAEDARDNLYSLYDYIEEL